MMIVMTEGATEEQIQGVVDRIEKAGANAHVSRGQFVTVIGAVGDADSRVHEAGLELADGVDHVVPIMKPYKLSSLQFTKGEKTTVEIDGRKLGGGHFALIAGPCTVESREQVFTSAQPCRDAGVPFFRGGAYKPRTSPYSFQGLGVEGLRILGRGQGRVRHADRHRADGRPRRRARASRSPTSSRSARATCRTTTC